MSANKKSKNYEIGYAKPPTRTRFAKGKSGNPNGRPKGSRNLKTDLGHELGKRIVVREGGRRIRTSKQEALIMRLFEQGLKGDMRALNIAFNLIVRTFGPEDVSPETSALPSDDREILTGFLDRQKQIETDSSSDSDGQETVSPANDVNDPEQGNRDDEENDKS
jgi:hypothetical protein